MIRALLRRPPTLPHVGLLSLVSLVLSLFAGSAARMWTDLNQPGVDAQAAQFAWLALTVVAYGAFLLVFPLVRWLRITDPAGKPGLWRWGLFFGLFLGATVAGCALRAWLAAQWLGPLAPAADNWLQHYNPVLWVAIMLLFSEREATFRLDVATEKAQLDREIADLFLSRELLRRTQARGSYEVLALLADEIEPSLATLHGRLATEGERSRAGQGPSDDALAALQGELDTLGDERIRRLSHLLHPSIIQLGLLPALRSLARHYEPRLTVTLEADAAFTAADDLSAGRWSLSWRLHVYRVIETALDDLVRQAKPRRAALRLAWSESEGLALELTHDGAPEAQAEQGLAHALIDSRIGLLGGHWALESLPDGSTRLKAELPPLSPLPDA